MKLKTCIRNVDASCEHILRVKYGLTSYGIQRFRCKECKQTFVQNYTYKACQKDINGRITHHLKEGAGIRTISRSLEISVTTVLKRIIYISDHIKKPSVFMHQHYEMDEMRTYFRTKNNKIWIAYSINRESKAVADFAVGRRTNKTLMRVIQTLLLSKARQINTDKLKHYRYLIPEDIHNTRKRGINHIERKNLDLRTHLKRLNRKTICFSKSILYLTACLKIYFWG